MTPRAYEIVRLIYNSTPICWGHGVMPSVTVSFSRTYVLSGCILHEFYFNVFSLYEIQPFRAGVPSGYYFQRIYFSMFPQGMTFRIFYVLSRGQDMKYRTADLLE